MSARYRLVRWLLTVAARLLFGLRCHGKERVPTSGPLIIASNHHSYIDPFVVALAVRRRMHWMAKKESFVTPLKQVLELLGAFPIDRASGGREGLRTAMRLLSEGRVVGIFPQGTRRRTRGADEDAKTGTIMLARRSGAKIVPVYVGYAPLPARRARGERLEVFVGEPIEVKAKMRGGKDYHIVANELLDAIFELGEVKTG